MKVARNLGIVILLLTLCLPIAEACIADPECGRDTCMDACTLRDYYCSSGSCTYEDIYRPEGTACTSDDAVGLAVAWHHNCALLSGGDVHCWGSNWQGQSSDYNGGDAVAVGAGREHSCALLSGGSVHCWGQNYYGESDDYNGGDAIAVAAGDEHSCALLSGGDVYCWGSNNYGQSEDYNGGDAIAVALGDEHSCALLSGGSVHCWGSNAYGESDDYNGGDAIAVGAGANTCVVLSSGDVHCWGSNPYGMTDDYNGGDAVAVGVGRFHSCALLSGGDVHCWGYNGNGQANDYETTPYCNSSRFCDGATYKGYSCDGSGNCVAVDIGCCASSYCSSGQYCRESDHSCQSLPTCAEPNSGFGYNPQENDEDIYNECSASWLSCSDSCTKLGGDGYCAGGGYECDTDDATSPVTEGSICAEVTEGFESGGFSSDWNVNNFNIQSDYTYSGSYSAGSNNEGEISATFAPSELSGGKQVNSVSFYWWEQSSQTGHVVEFINSTGDTFLTAGTENPQWDVTDADGKYEIYSGSNYEDWTLYKFTFNWTNGTYDYYMKNTNTGHIETGTRTLIESTDLEELVFSGSPYGTGDYNRFDNITITGELTGLCDESPHCVGDIYYEGYACDGSTGSGSCSVDAGSYDKDEDVNYCTSTASGCTADDWFSGTIEGSNGPCCGDDGSADDFYNSTMGCFNGEAFSDQDSSQDYCETLDNTWFTGTIEGSNGACCGDDGSSDVFGNSTNCCRLGSFQSGECTYSPANCFTDHVDTNDNKDIDSSDSCGVSNCDSSNYLIDSDVNSEWDGYCYDEGYSNTCTQSRFNEVGTMPGFNKTFQVRLWGNLTTYGGEVVNGKEVSITITGDTYTGVTDEYGGYEIIIPSWKITCGDTELIKTTFEYNNHEYEAVKTVTHLRNT